MTICGHLTITNPLTYGYPFIESIKSFLEFCDEIIVVDGGSTDGSLELITEEFEKPGTYDRVKVIQGEKWPVWYSWDILGRNRTVGFDLCAKEGADWIISFDADYVFHDATIPRFLRFLKESLNHRTPPKAVAIPKFNMMTADRYIAKTRHPFCVNHRDYPNVGYGMNYKTRRTFMWPIDIKERVKGLNIGNGLDEQPSTIFGCDSEIWVYDYTFMDYKTCIKITKRNLLAQAVFASPYITDRRKKIIKKDALKFFSAFMEVRVDKDLHMVEKISHHPKAIQEKLSTLTEDMFGYNMFGIVPFKCRYLKDKKNETKKTI